MKHRKILSLLLTAALIVTLFTGCGGSAKSEAAFEMDSPAAAPEEMAYGSNALNKGSGETGSTALPEGRKWVVTVTMQAETEDLDAMTRELDQQIKTLGGYVEDQYIYNGSSYSSRRYRNADLTVRIPAEKVEDFAANVGQIANVVSNETRRDDITLRYVDTQSRVVALETEQARLLELLEKAETMADLLEIEARLTDVRYELEQYSSQLRLYDNQVDYATIYLNITEVQEYTPVEEPTFWERITGGFSDNVEGLWEDVTDFTVWLITSSPYLLVYGILAVVLVLLIKRGRKLNIKKKEKKAKKDDEKK